MQTTIIGENMITKYEYTYQDFVFETKWNSRHLGSFDDMLTSKWQSLQNQGDVFRYKLNIDDSKILPGKFRYFAQLNINRASLRRKPTNLQSMSQKFDPNTFNFTKIDNKEIMFEVINKERSTLGNFVAVNVSPLESGHCLFLPALHSSYPQVVTNSSLLAALEMFLLSESPALRMGFNGLCAFASINHMHFHLYYLEHKMLLETIEVDHLAGPCYTLKDFPSKGFAFQLSARQHIKEFVRDILKLTSHLQETQNPYNIFITRGTSFQENCSSSLVRDHVRVYVWTRKAYYGAKELIGFHPAMCEMFGHLLIKTREDYDCLTEENVASTMRNLTVEPFYSVVDQVQQIFKEMES